MILGLVNSENTKPEDVAEMFGEKAAKAFELLSKDNQRHTFTDVVNFDWTESKKETERRAS